MSQANSKKVLLMGRHGAGKTSMRSIIFANYLARDTRRLTATNYVEHSHLRFLGNLVLSLWDCGGQDTFMENYFESQREHIFRNAEVLIYVIGQAVSSAAGGNMTDMTRSMSSDAARDLLYFKNAMDSIRQFSPNAKVFCLLHKMDLVKEADRPRVLDVYERELTRLADGLSITVFGTSIWDETLFKAWSTIVAELIPNVSLLEQHLDHFCNVCEADEVVLFEKSTFLVIAHVSRKAHKDPHRLEKVSNIAKQFKLTCGKSDAAFESLTVQAPSFTTVIEKFTHNTYVLLITSDPDIPTAATLVNIDAAREHFERIAENMKFGATL